MFLGSNVPPRRLRRRASSELATRRVAPKSGCRFAESTQRARGSVLRGGAQQRRERAGFRKAVGRGVQCCERKTDQPEAAGLPLQAPPCELRFGVGLEAGELSNVGFEPREDTLVRARVEAC